MKNSDELRAELDALEAEVRELADAAEAEARRRNAEARGYEVAGKTGTAQVVGLNFSDGKSGPWKYRDHGHFIATCSFTWTWGCSGCFRYRNRMGR